MRVLVTGSHGFIGSQLVKALKERGDQVYESDLKNGVPISEVFQRWGRPFEEIYHLACVNQEEAFIKQEENLIINALATKYMAHHAAKQGARFVYTSTASVYGQAYQLPTRSNWQVDPKTDYAVAKLAGEHFVENSGADYTVFRLSNVYGPGQSTENPYCGVVAKFLEAARAGTALQIIGDGSQTRDFTFVGDVLPHLMNPDLKGVLNCSSGVETSVFGLAERIDELFGRKLFYERTPERSVDGIQRRVLFSDVECPTSLPEGLQKTLEWLNDQ